MPEMDPWRQAFPCTRVELKITETGNEREKREKRVTTPIRRNLNKGMNSTPDSACWLQWCSSVPSYHSRSNRGTCFAKRPGIASSDPRRSQSWWCAGCRMYHRANREYVHWAPAAAVSSAIRSRWEERTKSMKRKKWLSWSCYPFDKNIHARAVHVIFGSHSYVANWGSLLASFAECLRALGVGTRSKMSTSWPRSCAIGYFQLSKVPHE